VWHDSLALVPRSQLGNVVSQIGDRQFADIIQPFLHEVRKITLGEMRIIAPRPYVPSDQPMVHVWPNAATNMPDWPMQENIKDFKGIDLKFETLKNKFCAIHFNNSFQFLITAMWTHPSSISWKNFKKIPFWPM
jgi:hypothetical protein